MSGIPAFASGTRVTIEYNSIDFKTLPEKRQYRCRIKKMDSDWRKPTKETSTDFIFDQPGTYTFEVQAIDRDLNYSEPAMVKLEVIPDPRNHRIAQLEGELEERERAEMERMQQELENARRIQQSLLPKEPPHVEGFEIVGMSLSAMEVSGDFYDYLSFAGGVGIVLADVTGKSVQAAMIAALANGMLHTAVRGREELWDSPGEILKELNMELQPRLIPTMFTAMSLGVLQLKDKRLLFTNAGMPYPIIKRGKKAWELKASGLPLGLVDSAEYDELTIDLEDGDFVIFYSDGVIEAENEAEEMYQTERLVEAVQQADSCISAQGMVTWIVSDVRAFVGDAEPSDDITIVVIRCKE
jgi:sigma-B regulation protein RsbU (phosphoserine phosphatase)